MTTTWFVIRENKWPVALLGKNGVNTQRRNNIIDQILCLISQNTHRNIQNNTDVLYSCGTDRAVVFKWYVRLNIWERNGIKFDTKLKVYKAVILPTLLYACKTWTVYRSHAKRLYHFHLSCLRKLLKIKWQDKIPDTEDLKKAGMQACILS